MKGGENKMYRRGEEKTRGRNERKWRHALFRFTLDFFRGDGAAASCMSSLIFVTLFTKLSSAKGGAGTLRFPRPSFRDLEGGATGTCFIVIHVKLLGEHLVTFANTLSMAEKWNRNHITESAPSPSKCVNNPPLVHFAAQLAVFITLVRPYDTHALLPSRT